MPTSAQDASITFGATTLSEVIDYAVDCNVANRDPLDSGSVVVRAFARSIPTINFGRRGLLTVSHAGTVVFKAGAVAERIRIDAATNDVLRYTLVFRVLFPSRNY